MNGVFEQKLWFHILDPLLPSQEVVYKDIFLAG